MLKENLGELTAIKTGRLDVNAENPTGKYPFFTCSKNHTYIDQFAFDGEFVLVAGNGDLNVKYYNGKFNAYQRTYVIQAKSKLDGKYLFYFLESYIEKLREQSIGGVIKYIKIGNLTDAKIPLPPLETQKDIAQILDDAAALRDKTRQLIKEYDVLAQSIFLEMFGDPVRNEKGFELRILQDFYFNMKEGTKCGPFGGALKKEEFVESGIAVWNMDNISKNGELIEIINLWITPEKYEKLKSYSVENNDIIISRAGTVGKMCVVNSNFKKSIISTNLIRLRLNSDKLLPLFFSFMMNHFKDRVGRLKKGSDDGFTHMNTGILNTLSFPYPPIDLQNQFAEKITLIKQQKELAKQELKESEDLFNCLLQKAFKGELG
ncbi:restriction endonuclease subunit S [Epilithonimonas lactis]|uniref:restriction endonuclease subunit S n=1 Tax=Epilithonimonas lactis TaxID=421072 RepID=UPI00068FCEFA|nr:restriction endonuclease subunit S [Epilithonimonas lactis]SEP60813.1 type I restriction enzyme, S subunit [Epilithonimonas lactis]